MNTMKSLHSRFGPGPHVVEVYVEFPQYIEGSDLDQWPRVRGTLRIEMAPLHLMPVAVNLFLQQIHHKLWNGCAFVINAEHIVQAGPHQPTPDGNSYHLNSDELANRFKEAGLSEMPFQEYRDEYPHEAYTIGYAGRPGGQSWYIKKVNNTENHGPGGQTHHNLNEEADPCFARLIGGWEVLELVEKIPTDGSRLVRPVVIADTRVVGSEQYPEQHHQHQQHAPEQQHEQQLHHEQHQEQYQEQHQYHAPEQHHEQYQEQEHHELQHEQHQEQYEEHQQYHAPEQQHEQYQEQQHHEQYQQQQ